jgi:nucleotide-binding universal stress UspA family protein
VPSDEQPVLVAFDGSPESQAAVRAAASLFGSRPLVVMSVWEPGLALALNPPLDSLSGIAYPIPDPETIASVDRTQHEHAAAAAGAGVQIAAGLGAAAEPLAVAEEVDVAETIAREAVRRDAAAVVVGSRGLGRVKALLGSTSNGLLRRSRRPVVVVRTED